MKTSVKGKNFQHSNIVQQPISSSRVKKRYLWLLTEALMGPKDEGFVLLLSPQPLLLVWSLCPENSSFSFIFRHNLPIYHSQLLTLALSTLFPFFPFLFSVPSPSVSPFSVSLSRPPTFPTSWLYISISHPSNLTSTVPFSAFFCGPPWAFRWLLLSRILSCRMKGQMALYYANPMEQNIGQNDRKTHWKKTAFLFLAFCWYAAYLGISSFFLNKINNKPS